MNYKEFTRMLRDEGLGFDDVLLTSFLQRSGEKMKVETPTEILISFGDGWVLWLDKKFSDKQEFVLSHLKLIRELFADSSEVMQAMDLMLSQETGPLESSSDMRASYLYELMEEVNKTNDLFHAMCAGMMFFEKTDDKEYLKLFYPEIIRILLKGLVASRFSFFDNFYRYFRRFNPFFPTKLI